MNKIKDITKTISMKKFKHCLLYLLILSTLICGINYPYSICNNYVKASNPTPPMLAIIIDDFGGYDQAGVETMLSIDAPLTCAIMPNLENTLKNTEDAIKSGKEVIVHMPMQAHVELPLNWYGTSYISLGDNKATVYEKLNKAFSSVPGAKGFNIHIGSGVCQNNEIMGYLFDYATENNLTFVDSRTHMNNIGDKVANQKHVLYLGRDEFLEPQGNKSYEGVKHHLMVGANLALDRGYAIVVGHVGVHGGEVTARAIKDTIAKIQQLGIEIVPLSKLHDSLNLKYTHQENQTHRDSL